MAPKKAVVVFKMRFILTFLQMLRFLFLKPLLLIAWRERVNFEHKNSAQQSRFESGSILFEVSSQGEWEQVRPLVIELLSKSIRIDILYASKSVEKEMLAFEETQKLVRAKRLELITKGSAKAIRQWSQARWVFLCRYDFYPELLLLKKDAHLVLLNATLINKTAFWDMWPAKLIYAQFHTIVWSSETDLKRGRKLNLPTTIDQRVGDLRPLAILERQGFSDQRLNFLGQAALESYWKSHLSRGDILIGSAWPSDIEFIFSSDKLYQDLNERKYKLWMAPHKLGSEAISALENTRAQSRLKNLKIFILDSKNFDSKAIEEAQIIINVIPGILCESYKYFQKVYVGGGYEKGIHSVSEPFFAAAVVAVGPNIHRSTEYEAAQDAGPDRIFRVTEVGEWDQFLTQSLPKGGFVGHDREVKLYELRNHLCSLAMSTLP